MAYFEASLVLTMLLQRCTIERTSNEPVRPAETIVMPIFGGLPVSITPRPAADLELVAAASSSSRTAAGVTAAPAAAAASGSGSGCPFASSKL